jgi:hypothetical protein
MNSQAIVELRRAGSTRTLAKGPERAVEHRAVPPEQRGQVSVCCACFSWRPPPAIMHPLPVASWDRKRDTQASPGPKLKAQGSKLTANSLRTGSIPSQPAVSTPYGAKFAEHRKAEVQLREIILPRNPPDKAGWPPLLGTGVNGPTRLL